MDAAGIIFADAYDVGLNELLTKRSMAAVPFGARYRVVDFALSNMVNADIRNVGVITAQKYGSLMGHLRSGEDWDMNRKNSGLTVLPPYVSYGGNQLQKNRLGAVNANMSYLRNLKEKYVVFTSSNYIANLDIRDMMRTHIKSGARVTALYTRNPLYKDENIVGTKFKVGGDGKILGIKLCSDLDCKDDYELVEGANVYILERRDIMTLIEDAVAQGKTSFRLDVLAPLIEKREVMGYEAKESMLFLDNMSSYLKSNLALLDVDIRDEIFRNVQRPIQTRIKDSSPGRFYSTAAVSNSLIAAGTDIAGTVKNSVIFRGVRIGEGAVVENSIVMQDSIIEGGARISNAILDKKCLIHDGRFLSGHITHPFYVGNKTEI